MRVKGAPVTSFVKSQHQELMVGSAFIHALTHHESCICSSLFVPLVSVTYRLECCHTQFSANPDISFIVSFSTEHTLLCLHDRQLVIVNN